MRENRFTGRGRVQVLERGGATLLRIDTATTQTRRLKRLVREFCRIHARNIRPWHGDFAVHIWTSEISGSRKSLDVDNIAKACLDALNGVFWNDDRQVVHLTTEKFHGDRDQIAIRVTPLRDARPAIPFDEHLFDR